MNYNEFLKIGEIFKSEYIVKESDTADASGNKGVRVLSTPALLKYIENGSSIELFNRLPSSYSPVGTHVDLRHLGATPVNGVIQVITKVIGIENNRFTYEFNVFYNKKIIAEGLYEQAVVFLEIFLKKNNAN